MAKSKSTEYPSVLYVYRDSDGYLMANEELARAVIEAQDDPGKVAELAIYQFSSMDKRKFTVVQG